MICAGGINTMFITDNLPELKNITDNIRELEFKVLNVKLQATIHSVIHAIRFKNILFVYIVH